MLHRSLALALASGLAASDSRADPPRVVTVTADNTVIEGSAVVRIAPGTVIADPDADGVIHIRGDGAVVEFEEGSVLRGAAPGTPWDTLSGLGVRVEGARNVTLRNLRVHGYKVGVRATRADGVTIDTADLSDNFRQRLKSTPKAEDAADWLWPHNNDNAEWAANYGAALKLQDLRGATVMNVRVRRGQNGIILDRVTGSKIYDNDCSFLSGWGLALWRSSDNLVSRNAFDFCVRGHSEGVYNRGQDSAGILAFEQCSGNVFVENSATHSGDGFFGFAGREALGEAGPADGRDLSRRGNNRNVFLRNDFSYAPAHGVEMTFSFDNVYLDNRVVENAICGFWLGYSQDSLIARNTIEGNGAFGYGPEGGGVNIEHAVGNRVLDNLFRNNTTAVHLWWDDDALLEKPWAKANARGVRDNLIAGNTITLAPPLPFTMPPGKRPSGLWLRDLGRGNVTGTVFAGNTFEASGLEADELNAPEGVEVLREWSPRAFEEPQVQAVGRTSPVSARTGLRGRQKIVMGDWGPWDHASPMIRSGGQDANRKVFEVFGAAGSVGMKSGRDTYRASFTPADGSPGLDVTVTAPPEVGVRVEATQPQLLTLTAPPGAWPFRVEAVDPHGLRWEHRGTIVATTWEVSAFPWTDDVDPRKAPDAWRSLADGPGAVKVSRPVLDFPFGSRGPRDLNWSELMSASGPGRDRFGIVAKGSLALPRGQWRVRTVSDDGVRVTVGGATLIENWTWHAAATDTAEFTSDGNAKDWVVEYFEIDGAAVLKLDIEPVE
jgi:parallel beta-helix repeat protein